MKTNYFILKFNIYLFSLFFVCVLLISSCKEDQPTAPPLPTSPTVKIISPKDNSSLFGNVLIEVEANDDKGIVKVEVLIDNQINKTFVVPPYSYTWNTQNLIDGSLHTIYAKAYDGDNNISSSEVINMTFYSFQPSNLVATLSLDTSVVLSWQDNSNLETGFEIEQSINDNNFIFIRLVGSNTTNTKISGGYLSGNIYYYKVRAIKDSIKSPPSNIDSVKVIVGTPTNLNATLNSETSVILTWENNSNIQTRFEVEQSIDGSNFVLIKTVDYSLTTVIDGMYLIDETYYFRIRAITNINVSNYSNIDFVTIVMMPPNNLVAILNNDTTAQLNWQDKSNIEDGFEIEKKINTNNYEFIKTVGENVIETKVDGIYLLNDSIFFRVRAIKGNKKSAYSNEAKTKLIFAKPSNLAVTVISDKEIKLQWSDNSTFEKYFEIQKSENNINFDSVLVVPKDISQIIIPGSYEVGKQYFFRVRALSKHNKSEFSNTTIAKIVFNAPSNLTITSISSNEIKIQWQDNTAFEKGFIIERRIKNQNFVEVARVDYNVVTWNDSQIETSNTYAYRIKAYTDLNHSDYSEIINVGYIITDATLQRTLTGHSNKVHNISISSNGQILASGSWDGTVKLWNINDGTLIFTLPVQSAEVLAMAMSPDGQIIATSIGLENTIKLWNATNGNLINTLTGHTSYIRSLAFSPDGQILASGSTDKTIKQWNVSNGTNIRTLIGHNDGVHAVSFSQDGQYIASGSFDNTNKIWNVSNGSLINTLVGHTAWVSSVSFSSDGKMLVSGSYDKTAKHWDIASGSIIHSYNGHSRYVYGVAFSPDKFTIASCSSNKTIKLWRTDGNIITTLSGHNDEVFSVAFTPNNKILASGGFDNTIRLWSLTSEWRIIP